MSNINDVQQLYVSELEIKQCIEKALKKQFHRRDNLRKRNQIVQFDCLLRGYIGELAIKNWFAKHNIYFNETNYLKDENGNIDIDLLYKINNKEQQSIEIKTSLIPDSFVKNIKNNDLKSKINQCLKKCDIKLIRRNQEPIELLKGDIHIQIYFGDLRAKKDNFLNNIDIDFNDLNQSEMINKIYNNLYAKTYKNRTFFVGWIDKKSLIKQVNNKPDNKRKWSFKGSRREFWNCNIANEAKAPNLIIHYLNSLKNKKKNSKFKHNTFNK